MACEESKGTGGKGDVHFIAHSSSNTPISSGMPVDWKQPRQSQLDPMLQVTVLELVRVSHDDSVYKYLSLLYIQKIIKIYMTHICGHLVYESGNIVHKLDT